MTKVSIQRAGLRIRRAWVQIAAAMLLGNNLTQTVHTHHASVHQAAKLVAALLRVAWWKVMAAYHRLTAKNRDQLWNPTLGNRVWATFTFTFMQNTSTLQRGTLCPLLSSIRDKAIRPPLFAPTTKSPPLLHCNGMLMFWVEPRKAIFDVFVLEL